MPFQHKYEVEIAENVPDECQCPPPNAIEIQEQIFVYRFVFDPLDEKSFIPTAVVTGAILEGKSAEICCAYHGLSMYVNEEKARKAFKHICSLQAEFPKIAGSYLGEGTLKPGDGLVTHPSRRSTHFTFHENRDCVLPPQFSIGGGLECS